MKVISRLFLAASVFYLPVVAKSQKIGMGTTNPAARLDITKPGGDTPTLNIRGSVNISHFNHGLAEHTYIRGGKSGSHVIINDVANAGFVGLGTAAPIVPLTFSGSLGNKIALWNDGASTHYGFGIQGGLMQIYSKTINDDIAFGYGNSNSFTETIRVKGNGALRVNGSEGTPGQVLQSNGSSSAASWQSLGSILPSFFLYNYLSLLINDDDEHQLPNSEFVLNITKPTRLIISAGYYLRNNCPIVGACDGRARCYFKLNGTLVDASRIWIKNIGAGSASGSLSNYFYDVNPGTYTITFFMQKDVAYGSTDFHASLQTATILLLPL